MTHSVPGKFSPVPDDPVPYSADDYGSFAFHQAHPGMWHYSGGLCSKCRSISPQTLMRLISRFDIEHMGEAGLGEPELLVAALRALADAIEREQK